MLAKLHWSRIHFFYRNQLFLAEAHVLIFDIDFDEFSTLTPLELYVENASSMNISQNTKFKISNLRLAVLISCSNKKKKVYIALFF